MSGTYAASALAFEGYRIGGNIRGLFDIIRKARELGIDFTRLDDLIQSAIKIGEATDLKGRVLAALEAMGIFAQATTGTQVDDQIVEWSKKIIGDGRLLDLLSGLIGKMEAEGGHGSFAIEEISACSEDFQAVGLNFSAMMEIIRLVMALLAAFGGK